MISLTRSSRRVLSSRFDKMDSSARRLLHPMISRAHETSHDISSLAGHAQTCSIGSCELLVVGFQRDLKAPGWICLPDHFGLTCVLGTADTAREPQLQGLRQA